MPVITKFMAGSTRDFYYQNPGTGARFTGERFDLPAICLKTSETSRNHIVDKLREFSVGLYPHTAEEVLGRYFNYDDLDNDVINTLQLSVMRSADNEIATYSRASLYESGMGESRYLDLSHPCNFPFPLISQGNYDMGLFKRIITDHISYGLKQYWIEAGPYSSLNVTALTRDPRYVEVLQSFMTDRGFDTKINGDIRPDNMDLEGIRTNLSGRYLLSFKPGTWIAENYYDSEQIAGIIRSIQPAGIHSRFFATMKPHDVYLFFGTVDLGKFAAISRAFGREDSLYPQIAEYIASSRGRSV